MSSCPVFSSICPIRKSQRSGQTKLCRPRCPPLSPAIFHHLPLFYVLFRFFCLHLPFPVVPRRPPPSLLSPITPYKNMSQIVVLVVLPNDGRLGNSRTRTDSILSSRLVIFSSCLTSRNDRQGRTTFCRPVSSRALGSPPPGPSGSRTTANTAD